MEILALFVTKLIDPIGLIISFIIIKVCDQKLWSIALAGFGAALISKIGINLIQHSKDWGDFSLYLLGGLMQAGVVFGLIHLKQKMDFKAEQNAEKLFSNKPEN